MSPQVGRPRTAEEEAELIIHHIPRFNGIRPADGGKWRTYIRQVDHSWKLVGEFDTVKEAWNCYQHEAHYVPRKDPVELIEDVERLITMAAAYPVQFKVERSLRRSCM